MLTKGTVLQGRYRIIRQIGGGGQAVVYLAEDLNWNAQRAVKQLTPDPTATSQERQDAYTQFRREAEVLAGLIHPNIVRVWDHFHEGRHAYLVMDYVDGRTLQEILDQTPGFLPEAAVRRWATQLCDVLAYLHQQQPPIIFRDLNPSNVMLDQNDQIKLIDFGIVRHFKAGQTTNTVDMGTEGYASLEHYGRGQTDPRSDIYTLGATLYHLLTRERPAPAPARVIPGQSDPLEPPHQYNRKIKTETEAVLMKALAVAPDQRFQSVAEMKRALSGVSVPPTTSVTVRQPPAKRGIGLGGLAIVGVVLLLGLGGFFFAGRWGSGASSSGATATLVGGGLPSAAVVLTRGTSRPAGALTPTGMPTSPPAVVAGATDTLTLSATRTGTQASTPAMVTTPSHTEPSAPSATPTRSPVNTVTPTHTPSAVPPAADTPTWTLTPRPTATAPQMAIPTSIPTATPEVITDPDRLTTFKLAIGEYRLVEKEALKTLDSSAVENLATYADGEALAAVTERIAEFRAQGLYQELVVRQLDVQQTVVRDSGRTAGVLVLENHALRTYQPAADGDRLVNEEEFDGQIVYGLIYLAGRWKVERIRLLDSSQP